MRYQSYFNTALFIIQQYKGEMPLAHFIKQYFAQHKKHGSKDRKIITNACYAYFRLGKALSEVAVDIRLKAALYLLLEEPGVWEIVFEPLWLKDWPAEWQQRWYVLQQRFSGLKYEDIFPFKNEVSEQLDIVAFTQSFFTQPDVFIRIRPGEKENIVNRFNEAGIPFQQLSHQTIAVKAGTKIDHLFNIDAALVIQDFSSQRIAEFLQLIQWNNTIPLVWDCCAASGGKSILAKDIWGNIQLTVSDVRESILHNLSKRFQTANISNYTAIVADLSQPLPKSLLQRYFDVVIADVPCTGSGTWSRTPEQLFFFSAAQINTYSWLQRAIVQQAIPQIKPDGYFIYITCSVFKQENQEMVAYIINAYGLVLIKEELLMGYHQKADTLFAALFQKPKQI